MNDGNTSFHYSYRNMPSYEVKIVQGGINYVIKKHVRWIQDFSKKEGEETSVKVIWFEQYFIYAYIKYIHK